MRNWSQRAEQRGRGSEEVKKKGLQSWATAPGRFSLWKGCADLFHSTLFELNKGILLYCQAEGQDPFRQAIMHDSNNKSNKKQVKDTVPAWSQNWLPLYSKHTGHIADNGPQWNPENLLLWPRSQTGLMYTVKSVWPGTLNVLTSKLSDSFSPPSLQTCSVAHFFTPLWMDLVHQPLSDK